MTAVVASALSPAVARSESYSRSDSPDPAVIDRLAREFSAVLSLGEAPDAMCVSVNLDGESILESNSQRTWFRPR